MTPRYQTILLFGAPGAGKGTQGKILGTIPGFHHVSSGDIFRSIDVNSELGRTFREYSTRGELVPDDLTIRLWSSHMDGRVKMSVFKPDVDLLVLDGIPRNAAQARLMRRYISVLKVIHLVCKDPEKMVERLQKRALKENRADDAKVEVIRRRWQVYESETYPVLECYAPEVIAEVDCLGSPAGVLQHILQHLVPVQEKHFRAGPG